MNISQTTLRIGAVLGTIGAIVDPVYTYVLRQIHAVPSRAWSAPYWPAVSMS